MTKKCDVQISGGMGFYQFDLLTRRAITWVRRNVAIAPYQIEGNTFYSDDTRYAKDIAEAMQAAGLAVR